MAHFRPMGVDSVDYHRRTVLGREDDCPRRALDYYGSRGETPIDAPAPPGTRRRPDLQPRMASARRGAKLAEELETVQAAAPATTARTEALRMQMRLEETGPPPCRRGSEGTGTAVAAALTRALSISEKASVHSALGGWGSAK